MLLRILTNSCHYSNEMLAHTSRESTSRDFTIVTKLFFNLLLFLLAIFITLRELDRVRFLGYNASTSLVPFGYMTYLIA